MAHRADLNILTPSQRTQLVNLMLNYLTDSVVAAHTAIVHSGLEIFTGHRAYLLGMENYLSANGGSAFVPLPYWDPAKPIPTEFNVVKNPGPSRPPLANLNPNIPKPPQFEDPAVCDYDDPAQLGNDINGWHGSVHGAIGGTMGDFDVASAAPIFWCWHAFVDHIYWDWQRCRVSVPDVCGCTLEMAKLKIKAGGLSVGSVACLPRGALSPSGYAVPCQDPDPSLYQHHGPDSPHGNGHPDHPHGQGGSSHKEPGHSGGESRGGKHGTHHGPAEPSHEFLCPTADYSYLKRGPRVITQIPKPEATAKAGGCVHLTVIE